MEMAHVWNMSLFLLCEVFTLNQPGRLGVCVTDILCMDQVLGHAEDLWMKGGSYTVGMRRTLTSLDKMLPFDMMSGCWSVYPVTMAPHGL